MAVGQNGCHSNIANHVFCYLSIFTVFLLLFNSLICAAISTYNFFEKKNYNLQNPIFVMYTDVLKFHVISPTDLMMNDLHHTQQRKDQAM